MIKKVNPGHLRSGAGKRTMDDEQPVNPMEEIALKQMRRGFITVAGLMLVLGQSETYTKRIIWNLRQKYDENIENKPGHGYRFKEKAG